MTVLDGHGEHEVRDEVREDLLGWGPETKTCDGCGTAARIGRWPIDVAVDGGWVAYSARCPDCDRRDNHVIVDPAQRW